MPTAEAIQQALGKVMDPELGRDIVSLGFVSDIEVAGSRVSFTIELTTPACPMRDRIREAAEREVRKLDGVTEVDVKMSARVRASKAIVSRDSLSGVKSIVAVASGKGGVGKSTFAANLGCALNALGARVGLMDLDAYGPTIPALMGATGRPGIKEERIVPLEKEGLKLMSMGFFMEPGDAAILRGPMLHRLVEQFLGQTEWGELDYLLADLPPGTGDIQISLCQLVPVTGAVIVSTPQDVALAVARKAIAMFRKLGVPVLGIVENMSYFVCPKCGSREEVFGSGGARKAALDEGIAFLGEIPLSTAIRKSSDAGSPVTANPSEEAVARAFVEAARNVAAQVSVRILREGDGGNA